MVLPFVAQNRIAISRLFWISGFIALLLSERILAVRLIGDLLPMAGFVLIGIAMVGRLWCSIYCKPTPRFFPVVARNRAFEVGEVSIQQFCRTARDVIWFVWLAGIGELIEVDRPPLVQPLAGIP